MVSISCRISSWLGPYLTSLNLTWLLSILLINKHALKQAQEELDLKVGRERWVDDHDIKDLIYLQAIVKETLHLCPPALYQFHMKPWRIVMYAAIMFQRLPMFLSMCGSCTKIQVFGMTQISFSSEVPHKTCK